MSLGGCWCFRKDMKKDWNYAQLSHKAKLMGGPEEYEKMLKKIGAETAKAGYLKEGRMQGGAITLLAVTVAGLAIKGVQTWKSYQDQKKAQQTANEARIKEANQVTDELKKYMKQEKCSPNSPVDNESSENSEFSE